MNVTAIRICVGALIRNDQNRVFIQRRVRTRRIFPGTWDIVGGHLEAGETIDKALAREIQEETGWELQRVVARIAEWEWEHEGTRRREVDFLVEVSGDLSAPSLEAGKHDRYVWIGLDELELMLEGRADGDHRLRDIVAAAIQWNSYGDGATDDAR
jgi:mutator protein MutT